MTEFKPLIEQAHKSGIPRDVFKQEILLQMRSKPRYALRGAAGEKLLGKELGEVFQEIDKAWNDLSDGKREILVGVSNAKL